MRIIRSDDEQIVSAHGRYLYGQNNNLYYNQQSNTSCAYDTDVDFSYSDKQFINELAKDRAYGTANIKPMAKDLNSFTERMYKDAVEEASRVKTMGYFNQFPDLRLNNPIHNSPHNNMGNHIKNNQVKNNNIINKGGHIAKNSMEANINLNLHKEIKTPNEENNIINFDIKAISPMNNISTNETPPNQPPNKYNALLDQVQNNIKHELATQVVEDDKVKLREQVKVEINNIPYRKTKEFVPTENAKQVQTPMKQQLQVRNCKESKKSKNGAKIFAKVCLGIFMIVSLIAVYLYCTGKLNLEVIKNILNI